ncbi:hypothetical protein Ana3638_10500 [Anaerocolumna sedimenticola]|uniref:VanZ-like domain-containing protein n=1 Tax=Anaerocolumna sedimenticola TaxID=2696063 RepID=A0A6P1TMS5_9FIRM|nr:VanZ family protein [Anaerocolumna sedimenticola]QHQ61146.1 hypothetical protein Ana3638_10500 [Anaerocolumna sedimenticola]
MFLIILFTKATIIFTVMIPLLITVQILFKYINHVSASISHKIGTYVFCFLLAGIFLVTGIPSITTIHLDTNISFDLFDGIFPYYDQYVNNIFLFIPFGFLLPLLWIQYNLKKTVFTGFLLSLIIETMQLFCFRISDVNDLWTNTLGTYLGYILFLVVKNLSPKIINKFCLNTSFSKKKGLLIFHEIYFYFFITWFVVFFMHPYISDYIINIF